MIAKPESEVVCGVGAYSYETAAAGIAASHDLCVVRDTREPLEDKKNEIRGENARFEEVCIVWSVVAKRARKQAGATRT